jgi:feruloyl esterase
MSKAFPLLLLAIATLAAASAQPTPDACAALKNLALDKTAILSAAVVPAGKLDLHQEKPDPALAKLPAFCRVVAVARPSADSAINIEVWLPLAGWNGKFMGQGNGGFAGSINYRGLESAVLSGFASGGTDTGHSGGATDSGWALGHPEKIVDFGYRGVHLMTELSKAVVQAFYAQPSKPNYFSSCSDGGREALMEAQRFPTDYDGILAGAPAYNWTSLVSRGAALGKVMYASPSSFFPASKLPALSKAVLAACGKGEPGPFLADPTTCHFQPETLLCKGAETDACLTQPQLDTLKAIYAPTLFKDGSLEYHGTLPGGELGDGGWNGWITADKPDGKSGSAYPRGFFSNLVYSNPNWELSSFNLDRDLPAAQQKTAQALDAVNPDLSAFHARGGKLILYHGWNDPAISPLATIDYYQSVQKALGPAETASFVRLFLVPGMQHCAGGPGPSSFGQWGPTFNPALDDAAHNITTALETWVEKGTAPEQIIALGHLETPGAAKPKPFTQPLCAWPKAAHYIGTGDKASAASYTCASQ